MHSQSGHGLTGFRRREDAGVIDIDQHDGVALLTLNHGKVNAVDVELLEAIAERLAALAGQSAPAISANIVAPSIDSRTMSA